MEVPKMFQSAYREKENKLKRKNILTVVLFAVLFILISCYDNQNGYSPGQEVMADCFIDFNLFAWEDVNGNGLWDESENPVEDVAFYVEGEYAESLTISPGISDSKGYCKMKIWYPGFCSSKDYKISVDPPRPYTSTTPIS